MSSLAILAGVGSAHSRPATSPTAAPAGVHRVAIRDSTATVAEYSNEYAAGPLNRFGSPVDPTESDPAHRVYSIRTCDDEIHALPAGVYFVRIDDGRNPGTARAVRLR